MAKTTAKKTTKKKVVEKPVNPWFSIGTARVRRRDGIAVRTIYENRNRKGYYRTMIDGKWRNLKRVKDRWTDYEVIGR